MNSTSLSRRDFIAAAAAAILPIRARGADEPDGRSAGSAAPARRPIGCHARPFRKYKLDPDGLFDAVKAAGYQSAEMMSSEWFAGWSRSPAVTPDYIAALKEKLASRGLITTIDYFDAQPEASFAEACAAARKQIDCAHALGQRYLLSMGTYKVRDWGPTCKAMSYAADYGRERGVQIAVKQHDGLNRTAVELLGWSKQVDNPNFGLFFDGGNLVYYTGGDPVEQLDIVGPYITGVVAKDCAAPQYMERRAGDPRFGTKPPDPHGNEVMIQFGTGKVDFAGMFRKLNAFGFQGPVMVEGVAVGDSLQQTIDNARANREYLERIFATT